MDVSDAAWGQLLAARIMDCKVIFSGMLPAAPETVEQHTVLFWIIQLPQSAPATTPATTPKMWTFTTKPPSAANAGLSMHAISLICGRFGVTEYAKWLICGTQNRIRRVQPAESQRSYSPYRQIGAINKPLSKTQSPESATNKPTSTPNVDFHSQTSKARPEMWTFATDWGGWRRPD